MTPGSDLHARLREEVGRFRQSEHRRRFDLAVHVGAPAGARRSLTLTIKDFPAVDRQVRVELVLSLLDQAREDSGFAWLTRPGVTELHDHDLAWLAASASAFGIVGRELSGFYALTREGWLDVRSGERRVWKRLRLPD